MLCFKFLESNNTPDTKLLPSNDHECEKYSCSCFVALKIFIKLNYTIYGCLQAMKVEILWFFILAFFTAYLQYVLFLLSCFLSFFFFLFFSFFQLSLRLRDCTPSDGLGWFVLIWVGPVMALIYSEMHGNIYNAHGITKTSICPCMLAWLIFAALTWKGEGCL